MFKLKKLQKSFQYAMEGLRIVYQEEQNFRIHLFFAWCSIFLGYAFSCTKIEWILISIVISLVLGSELANSAIEHCVDVAKPQISDVGKKIKDCMAAAVLVFSLNAVFVGSMIFLPKILSFLKNIIG